ncbi:stalk domain-containing protein [Paenibacillus sp. PL91]|uniref:stalk domain-containing protein n=1 Tax=Paenibacillus sp. PL91 TaxID=2729538 RepID=UPI00145C5841|nr:stalk domain-containing protein [Paenibacillus sp. PL91]MBC9204156.1 copper amine oxidase [Paenibacillus sp. PL91]
MKKQLAGFLIIFILCLGFPGQAYMEASSQQAVVFQDPNLEQAIKSWLGKKDDESLTKADLESLTVVYLEGRGIKDLRGLEYAVNITQLSLNGNEITDLTPLKKLSKIHTLSLKGNKIKSIEELSLLKEIKYLSISYNQISSLDLVKQLPHLNELDADHNAIEDIAPLSNIKELAYLNVSNNKIRDLSQLRMLPKSLIHLAIDSNQVSDLKPLEGFYNLGWLTASNNNIESLAPLAKLTSLSGLDLSSNKIKDLEPLTHLNKLSSLYLSNNRVWNLEPLKNLKLLGTLDLNNNRVWDLEPIQHIEFGFHWDTGAERYELHLSDNYLDLSQGSKTNKLFNKVNADRYYGTQHKTQRLVIGSRTAYVGDSPYQISAAPFMLSGRTYVPIRFISEKLGANVNWNQTTKEVTIQKESKTIRWIVGNGQVKVNQQTVMQDAPLLLKNGSAFVPVRFVAEQLNTSVEYMGSKNMVIIFEE